MSATVTVIPAPPAIPPPPRYQCISYAELETLPDPVWLIEHWSMRESITMIVGESESYKTFIAMDLAVKASDPYFSTFANGHNIDRSSASTFGGGLKVVYIIGESMGAAKWRIEGVKQYNKRPNITDNLRFHPDRVDLYGDPSSVKEMIDIEDPDIVIFDTWNRNTYGLDENSGLEVGKALAVAHDIKKGGTRGGRSVVFIHHPNKSGAKFRGHTTLLNDTDIMIGVERFDTDRENPAPFFTRVKSLRQKETDDFMPYWAKLDTYHLLDKAGVPIVGSSGGPLRTLVMTSTSEEPVGSGKMAAPLRDRVLEHIRANPGSTNPELQKVFWDKGGNHANSMTKTLQKEGLITGNTRDGYSVIATVFMKAEATSTLEEL